MENVKVFISQPMNGKTDEEILKERNQLIDCAKEHYGENIEVIDSFFKGAPHNANPLWFLGESIKKLSEADVAVLQKIGKKQEVAKSKMSAVFLMALLQLKFINNGGITR